MSEQFEAKEIGINKASTFRGFCANHDNQSFKNADQLDQNAPSAMCENIYRSLIYEKYKKVCALAAVPKAAETMKRGSDFERQSMLHHMMNVQMAGLRAGVESLDKNIAEVASLLDAGDVPISFCARAPGDPTCALSACYSPEFGLKGEKIQSLQPGAQDINYIAIIMFYKDGYNYTIMSGVSRGDHMRSYLRDAQEAVMKNYTTAISIALNYCENVYFSRVFTTR